MTLGPPVSWGSPPTCKVLSPVCKVLLVCKVTWVCGTSLSRGGTIELGTTHELAGQLMAWKCSAASYGTFLPKRVKQ